MKKKKKDCSDLPWMYIVDEESNEVEDIVVAPTEEKFCYKFWHQNEICNQSRQECDIALKLYHMIYAW